MNGIIIEECINEINQKGISFTMNDLAKKIGISKKTLYTYYTSKEKLIEIIIMEMKADIERQQIKIIEAEELDNIAKLSALLKIIPTDSIQITPVLISQLRKNYPELYQKINQMYHQDWERFLSVYEAVKEEGLVNELDILFFKEIYINAINNLPFEKSMRGISYREVVERTVDCILKGVIK